MRSGRTADAVHEGACQQAEHHHGQAVQRAQDAHLGGTRGQDQDTRERQGDSGLMPLPKLETVWAIHSRT